MLRIEYLLCMFRHAKQLLRHIMNTSHIYTLINELMELINGTLRCSIGHRLQR